MSQIGNHLERRGTVPDSLFSSTTQQHGTEPESATCGGRTSFLWKMLSAGENCAMSFSAPAASGHNLTGKAPGFTLIELMVAIAVLAIILGLGAPAFHNVMQNSRASGSTNDLVTALHVARSEASKRRQSLFVCRRNQDADACSHGTDWSVGWLVLRRQGAGSDVTQPSQVDVIQTWNAPRGSPTLTGPNTGVAFQPSGLVSTAVSFTVAFPGCRGDEMRTIHVSATGGVRTVRTTC